MSDLDYAKYKFFKDPYWRSMTHYVPLEWIAEHRQKVSFLCTSSQSPSLHEQLEKVLGIDIGGLPAHHNPSWGLVGGSTSNFTVLSERSKKVLAGSFLRSDLELYRLSGCAALNNETIH